MPAFSEITPMKDLKGYLKPKEVESLLKNAKCERDRLLLQVYWTTGSRVSEIVGYQDYYHGKSTETIGGLRPKDIVKDDDALIIITLKRRERFYRREVVPHEVIESLLAYAEEHDIDKDERVFPITRRRVDQIIKSVGERAGLNRVGDKKIHTHVLRHSHIVQWVRTDSTMEGLRKVQQRVKHASIATTAGYLQFETKEQKKDVEKAFGSGVKSART